MCVENHYYCGECYQCTHDQPHICQAMGQFGHGMGICLLFLLFIVIILFIIIILLLLLSYYSICTHKLVSLFLSY